MASPSKLHASTQDVPPPSMPASSGSLSASLYLPGSQKEDSAASSQSINGKKRNRGDGDITGDGISSQRRRSTRNPRIGLGFRNEPENLVQIMDEGEVAGVKDKKGEEAGDILPVDSLGILVRPLPPFGEGRIIPDSVCTADTLAPLRRVYRIPDAIRLFLPHRGYDVYTPPASCLLIHVATFECGIRLSLHPSISRLLVTLGLAPLQISPEFWKNLTRLLVLQREQCEKDGVEREPSFDDFRYVFQITSMVPRGQFYLRPKNKLQFVVPGANVKFILPWKDEWVVVEGDWGQSVYLDGAKHSVPIHFFP
ncbi:hypothetical protein Q3G72_021577 [Acer saccharum]|nr:hypothetical protein Q3G72_021577 [Acer saccharum]